MAWTPPSDKAYPDEPDHIWIMGVFSPRVIRDDRSPDAARS